MSQNRSRQSARQTPQAASASVAVAQTKLGASTANLLQRSATTAGLVSVASNRQTPVALAASVRATPAAVSRVSQSQSRAATAVQGQSRAASAYAPSARLTVAGRNSRVSRIAADLLALNASFSANTAQSQAFASASAAATQAASAALSAGFSRQSATRAATNAAASVLASATSRASGRLSAAQQQQYLSELEQLILRSTTPVQSNEQEEIEVNGERGQWLNREEVVNWRGEIPIEQYEINQDANPEVINKQTNQQLEYVQELAVRYLRPPTPPAPGEILIKQDPNTLAQPAPPLIIRQQPARAETPAPLVIREAPPQPPAQVGQKVITISGKNLPPPARKVVIERLAALPVKPQSVLIERWLPYAQVKRRVIFQGAQQGDAVVVKPRNVIVQWEAPQVNVKKEVKYLGVVKANPVEYVQQYGAELVQSNALPELVNEVPTPEGLVLAANYQYNELHELEGDVQALKLVDLDAEGLSAYREWVAQLPASSRLTGRFSRLSAVASRAASRQSQAIVSASASLSASQAATRQSLRAATPAAASASASVSAAVAASQAATRQSLRAATPAAASASVSAAASQAAATRQSVRASQAATRQSLRAATPAAASASASVSAAASQAAATRQSVRASQAAVSRSASAAARLTATAASVRPATVQLTSRAATVNNLVEAIFRSLDFDNDGRISVDEAGRILLRLNSRLGRNYGEDDVVAFFQALDVNNDGTLSFDEFRQAFLTVAA